MMNHTSARPSSFARFHSRIVIEGYGPLDLIDRVSAAPWRPCVPLGLNFSGIALGSMLLSDQPDHICPEKYRILVETIPTGDSFTVEGYQIPQLLDSLWLAPQPVTFAGYALQDEYGGEVNAYRVTIQQLSGEDSLVTSNVRNGIRVREGEPPSSRRPLSALVSVRRNSPGTNADRERSAMTA